MFKRPTNVRELLVEQYFLPWLASYFKESKCEGFTLMATPEMAQLLQENKVGVTNQGHFELNKMSKETYLKFRALFVEQKMEHPLFQENEHEAMYLIL